jgi:hypothetical protein
VKFKFIGNGKDNPKKNVSYGYTFYLNGPGVDVSEVVARKLSGNSHFKQVNERGNKGTDKGQSPKKA